MWRFGRRDDQWERIKKALQLPTYLVNGMA